MTALPPYLIPTRLPDWQNAFASLVVERLDAPFVWGTNDCAIFAADAVLAITGEDPMEDLRGQWTDWISAARAIASVGGLEAALEDRGFARLLPLFAQRGDVVVYEGPIGKALAMCAGDSLIAPGETGLQRFSISQGVSAWRK